MFMTWEILLTEDSSYVWYTLPNEVILYSPNKNIFIIVMLVWRVPTRRNGVCLQQ